MFIYNNYRVENSSNAAIIIKMLSFSTITAPSPIITHIKTSTKMNRANLKYVKRKEKHYDYGRERLGRNTVIFSRNNHCY